MNAVLKHATPPPRRKRLPRAQLLFRSCAVHCAAYVQQTTPEAAAERLFAGDGRLKTYISVQRSIVQRGAVDPAMSTVPEWAGNLARETWAEFLELLQPTSVYAQLAAIGARFTFDNTGKVHFPGRDSTPSLAGDFVGENAPIPIKKAGLKSATLSPKKLAVISAFSQEMGRATGNRMEGYVRDFMIEDTAKLLDTRLLDAAAATTVRPAGLLNGATTTASAGDTVADITTDVKAALAPILVAGGGRRLVWLMNPLQAMSLCLLTSATGSFIWPTADEGFVLGGVIVSPNVPAGTLILVDAAEFVTVADDAPQFVVSTAGVLHLEDTTPEPINDGTPATPTISLFQQDGLAVRMVQQMNWVMRRPGMVSVITGITW